MRQKEKSEKGMNLNRLLSFAILFFVLAIALSSVVSAQIDYWKQDDNTQNVFFKIPLNFNGTKTFYIYNDNGYAQNINNVFIFGDDFNDQSFNTSKWTLGLNNSYTPFENSDGKLVINATANGYIYSNVLRNPNNTILVTRTMVSSASSSGAGVFAIKDPAVPSDNVTFIGQYPPFSTAQATFASIITGSAPFFSLLGTSNTAYHVCKLIKTPSTLYGYFDSYTNSTTTSIYQGMMKLGIILTTNPGDYAKFDYAYINKYVTTVPKVTKTYNSAGKYWKVVINNTGSVDLTNYAINVSGVNLTGNLKILNFSIASATISPSPLYTTSTMKLYCNSTGSQSIIDYKLYKNNVTYIEGVAFNAGSITSGVYKSCGIRANDSKAVCWGITSSAPPGQFKKYISQSNDVGIYFNDSVLAQSYTGIERTIQVTDVNIGGSLVCMIRKNDSRVLCWAISNPYNYYGQIGDGTNITRLVPTLINSSIKFKSINPGGFSTCGIRMNDSRVMCWGLNYGYNPVQINSTIKFSKISVNIQKYGIRANDSRVMTWTGMGAPTLLNSTSSFSEVSTYDNYACGIRANDSRVLCWGDNTYGKLGDGTTTTRANPTLINDSSKYISISAGYEHTCGVRSDSRVLCWGWNSYGEVGDGTTTERHNPTLTTNTASFLKKSTDSINFLNLTSNYLTANDQWKLSCRASDGTDSSSWTNSSVRTVQEAPAVLSIQTPKILPSPLYTTSTMQLYCNSTASTYTNYKLFKNSVLYQSGTSFNPSSIVAGSGVSCGIRSNDSRVLCWGNGDLGALGDGTYVSKNIPTLTSSTAPFKSISMQSMTACGIRVNDSRLMCWGQGGAGAIGDGTIGSNRNNPTNVNSTRAYREVSVSFFHGCAIRSNDSRIECWGTNTYYGMLNGMLGDGTNVDHYYPKPINSTASFKSLSAGMTFTCALRANDSRAMCWGYNGEGMLGDGTTTERWNPTLVNTTTAFLKISASPLAQTSGGHVCGIRMNDSRLMCWGNNDKGQFGDGTNTSSNNPKVIPSTIAFKDISAGLFQTCAIRSNDSKIMCWGENEYGQLGDGTTTDSWTPKSISSTRRFISVSTGSTENDPTPNAIHTCGIDTTMHVLCWGANLNGQLGDSTNTPHSTPALTSDLSLYSITSTGYKNIFNLTKEYLKVRDTWELRCQASNTTSGTDYVNSLTSTVYTTTPTVSSVTISPTTIYSSTTMYGNCTYDGNKVYYRWYKNGALNTFGSTTTYPTFSQSKSSLTAGDQWIFSCRAESNTYNSSWINSSIKTISSSLILNTPVILPSPLYVTNDMQLYCNSSGDNAIMNYNLYRNNVTYVQGTAFNEGSISAGFSHSCGIRANDSRVMCWGYNDYAELGDGSYTQRTVPTLISSTSAFKSVSAGYHYSCGIRNDGKVLCWGWNYYGQGGDGTITAYHTSPTLINSTSTFNSVVAGASRTTCGIRANDSRVMCWGWNGDGEVGDGTTTMRLNPTLTSQTSAFKMLDVGNSYACGIKSDDTVICWGVYSSFKSGTFKTIAMGSNIRCGIYLNGTMTCAGISSPILFSSLSAGNNHACGIRANDSRAMCWGDQAGSNNDFGQLGDGTTTDRFTPTLINSSDKFISVEAGLSHTCAKRYDGRVLCWGDNTNGRLGDGTTTQRISPTLTSETASFVKKSVGFSNIFNISNELLKGNEQWKLSCQLSDGTLFTNWINSSVSNVQNTAPSVNSATIIPTTVYSNSTMKGYCNITDAESSSLTAHWRWYKNGALDTEGSGTVTKDISTNLANKSSLVVNDQWIFSCKANDGVLNSTWMNSSIRTIGNNAPVMNSVIILPSNVYSNDTMLGYCNGTDLETSNLRMEYQWYKNAVADTSGNMNVTKNVNTNVANKSSLTVNDQWILSCRIYDGTDYSSWMNSSSKTIKSLANIENVSIEPSIVYKNDTMLGYCNASGDASSIKVYWKWYRNTVFNSSGNVNITNNVRTNIANKTDLTKNELWTLSCMAYDGAHNSSWVNASRTVSNHAPDTPIQTYPANLANIHKTWTWLNWTGTDLDNDTLNYYLYFGNSTGAKTRVYSGALKRYNASGLQDGVYYQWYVIANDGNLNSSNSTQRTFYVAVGSPAITIVRPTTGQWLTSNLASSNITIVVTDSHGIDTCKLYTDTTGTYKLNQTKTAISSGANTYFYLNLASNKTYRYSVWCNNTIGLSTQTTNTTFNTDDKHPRMTISSPVNGTTYNSNTLSVTMSATDYYTVTCDYLLSYYPSMSALSSGTLNCTGTTVVSTPYYATGYVINITSRDIAGNRNSTTKLFYAIAPTTPVSGSGTAQGGGAPPATPKRDCNIKVDPKITFYENGIAEVTVTNLDTVTYNPSLEIKDNTLSPTAVELTNTVSSVLPKKSTSFGVRYEDVTGSPGEFKVVLTDVVCKDVVILASAGNTGNQVDIVAQVLAKNGVTALLTSTVNTKWDAFKVWMLYGLIVLGLSVLFIVPIIGSIKNGRWILFGAIMISILVVAGVLMMFAVYGFRRV